jgi:hypothetical protein
MFTKALKEIGYDKSVLDSVGSGTCDEVFKYGNES